MIGWAAFGVGFYQEPERLSKKKCGRTSKKE